MNLKLGHQTQKEAKQARYDPSFTYGEFLVMSSVFRAVSFTLIFVAGFFLVAFAKLVCML